MKRDQWIPEAASSGSVCVGGGWVQRSMRESGGGVEVIELFHILIMVVVTQIYAFVKTHRTIRLKGVDFKVCKL